MRRSIATDGSYVELIKGAIFHAGEEGKRRRFFITMKIQEMKMLLLRLLCLLPIIGIDSLLPSDGFPLRRRLRPRPSRYEGCVAMLGTEEPGAIRRACGEPKTKTNKSKVNAFSYLQKKEYGFFLSVDSPESSAVLANAKASAAESFMHVCKSRLGRSPPCTGEEEWGKRLLCGSDGRTVSLCGLVRSGCARRVEHEGPCKSEG